MFLPVGDNVEKRTLPLVGSFLIAVSVLAFAYEVRLYLVTKPEETILVLEKFAKTWGLVPKDLPKNYGIPSLITHQFLHGSVGHLIGNMICLWAFVITLEGVMGPYVFLTLYLFWGAVAGFTHAAVDMKSDIPLIGASGAIAGVMGAYFTAFGWKTKVRTLFWFFGLREVWFPAATYLGLWFITQVLSALGENGEPIAWFAHIGGFIIGALTMALIKNELSSKLVQNKEGVYELMSEEDLAHLREQEERNRELGFDKVRSNVSWKPPMPEDVFRADWHDRCPYCGTPVTPEQRIASSLVLCLNPDGQRLIPVSSTGSAAAG